MSYPRPVERNPKLEDDEYDGHESDSDFKEGDDREVLRKSLHHLGLAKNFAPQWLPRDAFREFYQNWKDGIVESFGVHPHAITPVFVRNDDQEIQITVSTGATSGKASEKRRLLGYIRFQSKQGTLELTNFKAKLDRKHLDLGETSKRNNNALAGGHGEGFKLAALVMRRNGHSVKFETNSFCWNFSFRGTRPRLCCLLNNPGPKLKREQLAEYDRRRMTGNAQRGLTPYIWEDMTVKIGKSRDKEGAQKVSEQDFRAWMKVALDLDPPKSTEIVRTKTGDLIFDPRFRGRIYLHGLLVTDPSGDSPGVRRHYFGYNFHQGRINRDRQRMTDELEEATTLASIWDQAILLKGDSVVDAYIKLFTEDEEAADIVQAYKYTTRLTAQNLCRRLKESHPEAFFYSERSAGEQNATTDVDIISKELKKLPHKLGKNLWWVIRQVPPLMRTPLEERNHLFETSQPVQPGNDAFSLSIIRALNGSFALEPRLSKVRIEFVDGADTAIDLLYKRDQDLLQIHAKWLDVARAHRLSSCEFFKVAGEQMTNHSAFLCDHVVQDLLEVAFEEVREPLRLAPTIAARLRRNAVEHLRKMPRAIKMQLLNAGRKVKVKWVGNESGAFTAIYGTNINYWVTLHKESSCRQRKTEVLNPGDTTPDQAKDLCNCPSLTVSQAHSEVVFDGLDLSELYFPMVSRAEAPSFFGLPPPSYEELESDEDYCSDLVPPEENKDSDWFSESDEECNSDSVTLEDYGDSGEGSQVKAQSPKASVRPNASTLSNAVALEKTRLQKDEQDWLEWFQQQPPHTQPQDSASLHQAFQIDGVAVPALHSLDLNLTFERHHYYRVLLEGQETEQVIFIHKISQDSIRSGVSYSLLVTRYSALSSVFPLEKPGTTGNPSFNDQEVILHFRNFDKMRMSEDAETVSLDGILSARLVGSGRNSVSHIFWHHPDVDSERLFCRFGISNADAEGRVTARTPLASHLLLHHDDPSEQPGFRSNAAPVAFDLTPSVLGVSEGFAGRGFMIEAGFGLDEMRHHTWINRHLVAQYFDGAIPDVFKDFDSGKLQPIKFPDPTPPKVLLFAGEHAYFRLNPQNRQMPTLRQFLKPLDAIDKAVEALKPDFVVILLPLAILHPLASSRFSKLLLELLEKGFSVQSTVIPLRKYGLPQERSIVAVIASPVGVSLPWKFDRYATGTQASTTVGSLIGDLSFKNSRMGNKSNTGFVCSPPFQGPEPEMSALGHTYNHYTGLRVAPDAESISMDSNAVFTFFNVQKEWIHPVRKDRVTVRELARVQGIPDELRFFGSKEEQYETVCKAIPPVIVKMIAHTIREAIDNSRVVTITTSGRNSRSKRARVEEDDEEMGGSA